jgi:hypothetical protein
MAREKWQRRHYETIAAGLKEKRASGVNVDSEVASWISKFAADNPRFRSDFFRAAIYGGKITRRSVSREYRPVAKRVKPFKVPSLGGYYRKKCKFGKKRYRGRLVCRKSRRK